jgi:hypothetical protein
MVTNQQVYSEKGKVHIMTFHLSYSLILLYVLYTSSSCNSKPNFPDNLNKTHKTTSKKKSTKEESHATNITQISIAYANATNYSTPKVHSQVTTVVGLLAACGTIPRSFTIRISLPQNTSPCKTSHNLYTFAITSANFQNHTFFDRGWTT